MELSEVKAALSEIEGQLPDEPFVVLWTLTTDGGPLRVAVTERLRRRCRKGRVWKSAPMLTALKNAKYGLREGHLRSRGEADGIFLIDRGFTPANSMMRKLFGGFLDKPSSGAESIASALHTPLDQLLPVRIVSHHMRLLGVVARSEDQSTLVLVDYDDDK